MCTRLRFHENGLVIILIFNIAKFVSSVRDHSSKCKGLLEFWIQLYEDLKVSIEESLELVEETLNLDETRRNVHIQLLNHYKNPVCVYIPFSILIFLLSS